MPSSAEVAAERRAVRAAQMGAPLPPVEQDPLPCPRCSSKNTKFCYYNNYNFSQPRHFCKSCRRYWTHGGALRDVPVGGGSRKSAKRSRTSASVSPCSTAAITSTATSGGLVSVTSSGAGGGSMGSNLEGLPAVPLFTSAAGGGFASLLSLGGFGVGLGLGLDEVGFGIGRSGGGVGVWAFPEASLVNAGGGGGGGESEGGCVSREMDTWRVESGGYNQDRYVNVGSNNNVGECFAAMPELAISTTGNGLK